MINFATLQGLTIPEGAVTQIADVAKNVLWSAVKPFSVYLRPSSDISVEHTILVSNTEITDGSVSAYSCINEEVSDGAATYIRVSDASSDETWTYATSHFGLSANIPNEKVTVKECFVVLVDPSAVAPIGESAHEISLFIDNTEIGSGSISVDGSKTNYEISVADASGAINAYIDNHGEFPLMSIKVTSGSSYTTNKNVAVNNVVITQLYVELVCV